MSLESLPDRFDDATHDELDRAVNADADVSDIPSETFLTTLEARILLMAIVNHSKGDLDSKYTFWAEASTLVKSHTRLKDMLQTAWKHKSYREIRNLAILNAPGQKRPMLATKTITDQDLQKGLSESFEATYRGAAVDGFYEYLSFSEKRFRTTMNPSYYAKFCSIVQSSGTGKSRLLTELSKKHVIVLYMNLRGEQDKLSFPARDSIPATILTEFPHTGEEYRTICYAFFIALFETVEEQLSTVHSTRNSKSKILRWAREMCDMSYSPNHTTRNDFFSKISEKYKKVYADLVRMLSERRTSEMEKSFAESDIDDVADVDTATDRMKNLTLSGPTAPSRRSDPTKFSTRLFAAYRKMTARLDNVFPGGSTEPNLVIALDEAHPLTSVREGGYRPADILCRIVNEYSHHDGGKHAIWVVFASTTSKVADFSPPNKKHNSNRVSVKGEKLFEPYTQLGWDQNASGLGDIDVKDVSRLDHITGFGRPLWKSLETSLEDSQLLMDTACSKLCGSQDFNPNDMNHVLAVVGQRFGMDVALGHPDSVEHLENGVASHMRICLSTTLERSWRFTKYPSEPLLSCASAHSLHLAPEGLRTALDNMLQALNAGMIEKGQRGELASRLLWLLAKDLYVRSKGKKTGTEWPSTWDGHLADCEMIPVVDWLEFVFGPQIWNGDSEGMDPSRGARASFENAYVNFSHWVCMEADIDKSNGFGFNEWTLRHWTRTSAVQCCHQQPRIDKVIPIYFDGEHDGRSAESRMSHIFISDKARESSNSKGDLNFITRDSVSGNTFSRHAGSSTLPYIAIMADLGQPPSLSVTFPERMTDDRCMRIYAGGVDPSTYPFLANHSALHGALEQLVHIAQLPDIERPYGKYLDAQVKFGSTATAEHMLWEHGKDVPPKKRA